MGEKLCVRREVTSHSRVQSSSLLLTNEQETLLHVWMFHLLPNRAPQYCDGRHHPFFRRCGSSVACGGETWTFGYIC
jgi:hypothetical protein